MEVRVSLGAVARTHPWGSLSLWVGGAPTEDLRALSRQNISLDIATFKKLQTEVLRVRLSGRGRGRGT